MFIECLTLFFSWYALIYVSLTWYVSLSKFDYATYLVNMLKDNDCIKLEYWWIEQLLGTKRCLQLKRCWTISLLNNDLEILLLINRKYKFRKKNLEHPYGPCDNSSISENSQKWIQKSDRQIHRHREGRVDEKKREAEGSEEACRLHTFLPWAEVSVH